MTLPDSLWGVIIGGGIAFLSSLAISALNNSKSNVRLEKQLVQSEKNLRIQLLHEDQKRLLSRIHQIMTGEVSLKDKEIKIERIFDSISGEVLPFEFKQEFREKVRSFWKELEKIDPQPEEPSYPGDDLIEQAEQNEQKELKLMHPSERYDYEAKRRSPILITNLESLLKKAMKGEYDH